MQRRWAGILLGGLGLLAGCGPSPRKARTEATVRLPRTFNAIPVYPLSAQPGTMPELANAAKTPVYLVRSDQLALVRQLQNRVRQLPHPGPYQILVTGFSAEKPATDAAWLYQHWVGKVSLSHVFLQSGPPTWYTKHPPIWVYPSWQNQCFKVKSGVPSLSMLRSALEESNPPTGEQQGLLPGQVWPVCGGN